MGWRDIDEKIKKRTPSFVKLVQDCGSVVWLRRPLFFVLNLVL